MVDLTRRKTVIGLGLLATGSGATFTSAAFQSSTQPESDLRVLVEQNLQFGANPNLPDTDDYTGNPDFFNDDGTLDESDGGAFEDGGDDSDSGEDGGNTDEDGDGRNEGFERSTPLAYVDGVNDELTVKTVVDVGTTHTFDRMFQLQNNTDTAIEFGIAYDRNNLGTGSDDDGNGQYGEDIDTNNDNVDSLLGPSNAQRIYQFQVNGPQSTFGGANNQLISPESEGEGVSGGVNNGTTISYKEDRPNSLVEVGPGDSVEIDLVVDTKTDKEDIKKASEIDPTQFGFQTDTVQIMEEITIVSQPVSAGSS